MKITLLYLALIITLVVKSQDNRIIDSLQNILKTESIDTSKIVILNKISQEYLKQDFNKSLEYAQKALALSKKINDEKSIGLSYTYLAYAQYRLKKYDEALININKALTLFEIRDDVVGMSRCYSFISQVYFAKQEFNKAIEWVKKSIKIKVYNNSTKELEINYLTFGAIREKQAKYDLALQNFFKAIKYYDKNGNSKSKASVYNNIAMVYRRLDKDALAEEFYNKSLDLNIKNNDKLGELRTYNNLAVLFEKQGLKTKAILNYKKVIKLSKIIDYKDGLAMSQINLAGIYIDTETNIDSSLILLKNSEKICIESNDNFKLIYIYGLLGQFYDKINNLNLAIKYSKKAFNIANKINVIEGISNMSEQLSALYKSKNDFKNSLKYYEIYHNTNDSIYNIEKTKIIEELKNNYEISKKENELQIKQQKIEMLEKQAKIETITNYISIAIKILVFVIITLIIIYYVRKAKKNKETMIKNKKIAEMEKQVLELKLKTKELKNQQLAETIDYKDTELQNFAHYIIDKNDFIIKIQKDIKKAKKDSTEQELGNSLQNILTDINNKIQLIRNNEEFLAQVDQIHNNFYLKLKQIQPEITENEQRLASLLKMGLSSKEIASIMHITPKSVDTNRYRLRKKLNLSQDINLQNYFKNL